MVKVLASGLSRHVLPINEVRRTQLNVPSAQQRALPFYHLLPKDPIELLKWKIYVRTRCLEDLEFRANIEAMCTQDIAFWAATFGWVFEPRPPRGIPLTMWCDQVDCLVWMKECLDTERDLGFEKTRGLYLSWTTALFVYWVLRYMPEAKIAYVTKDENTMDGPDANSFLGKVSYLHEKMPAWVRIGRDGKSTIHRTFDQHLIIYKTNASSLQGFPPTNQNVRSLRFTVLINDEFAFFPRDAAQALVAAAFTTNCRIFISTWFGSGTEFHNIMRVQKSTMLRCEAYWWNNPERWKGAYTTEHGRLKIIDSSYPYPPDYPFELDGLLRSPWVDYEFRKPGAGTKQKTLEELYGLQGGSGRKLVRPATLDVIYSMIEPPRFIGEIDIGGKIARLNPKPDGRLRMYADLGDGKGGPFSAACDLGFGHGATDSTLEVIDLTTAKHVLDFADNTLDPVSFAQFVTGVCRWLCGHKGDGYCFLDFENNGDQGTSFGGELVRLLYGNIRERRYKRKVPNSDKISYLGTHSKDGGLVNILEMERAILAGELTVVSAEIWEELKHFDKDEGGCVVFNAAGMQGHGDRVQGLGMAWMQARDKLIDSPGDDPRETAQDEIKNIIVGRTNWTAGWRMGRGAA